MKPEPLAGVKRGASSLACQLRKALGDARRELRDHQHVEAAHRRRSLVNGCPGGDPAGSRSEIARLAEQSGAAVTALATRLESTDDGTLMINAAAYGPAAGWCFGVGDLVLTKGRDGTRGANVRLLLSTVAWHLTHPEQRPVSTDRSSSRAFRDVEYSGGRARTRFSRSSERSGPRATYRLRWATCPASRTWRAASVAG